MIQNKSVRGLRRWLWLGIGVAAASSFAVTGAGQEQVRSVSASKQQADAPQLSSATALLESAVREMYQSIEPGNDTSPNELLAYADLRALRLYTGALEVAGWSLEKSATDYRHHQVNGAYRGGQSRSNDPQAVIAQERFRAYREATRTLLSRVRTTAVLVEHQVSFCDPDVSREWRRDVLPHLRDAIAATDPLFADDTEEIAFQNIGYGVPGQAAPAATPVGNTGIPRDAVEVVKAGTYAPHEGHGRGQGRYIEIRAYSAPIRVKAIRFRSHENAFGLLGTSVVREIGVEQVVQPGQPVFIPCNQKRWVDISELQIEWENADRNRRAFGQVLLVSSPPQVAATAPRNSN